MTFPTKKGKKCLFVNTLSVAAKFHSRFPVSVKFSYLPHSSSAGTRGFFSGACDRNRKRRMKSLDLLLVM